MDLTGFPYIGNIYVKCLITFKVLYKIYYVYFVVSDDDYDDDSHLNSVTLTAIGCMSSFAVTKHSGI